MEKSGNIFLRHIKLAYTLRHFNGWLIGKTAVLGLKHVRQPFETLCHQNGFEFVVKLICFLKRIFAARMFLEVTNPGNIDLKQVIFRVLSTRN